ncbi:MAG TPA: cyclopropane-fatty-acyl-phospholipid synthase family protein [Gammaproteobacteria bacterium]|nr:cyclopropane-fatty-acyl-phospholipid synthase family protein [Gammaproteobacteria bacterium]
MDGIEELTMRAARPPMRMRFLHKAAAALHTGTLKVVSPDGSARTFTGQAPGPSATLRVRDLGMVTRLLVSGDLGLAEAYMDGQWDTPDLMGLLHLGQLNAQTLREVERPSSLRRLVTNLLHAARRNTRSGARRNIEYHYDLGNDFYRLWLDESLTYSSAIFASGEQPLFEAQQNKYRRLVEALQLGPEHHLLEIGSGWGGFAIHAARHTGCRVTGITLSPSQLQEARARAAAAGLSGRVEFQLRDYRDLDGSYDRIASIEMFEAVGEAYWSGFFQQLQARLKPGGRAALQVITIRDAAFDEYRKTADFIQRYIFPGGMLPSPSRWQAEVERAGLRTEVRSFHGRDYARTLQLWDQRFGTARPAVMELGFDERFLRMWHYYLAYCHAGFATGHVDLMQTVLTKDP